MDDFVKEALEIARAQASVRAMTEDQIAQFVTNLANQLRNVANGLAPAEEPEATVDGKDSIKETSVTCLECGKKFKILSKKHLATHGLTTEEYKEKYGLKKKDKLVAKGLVRARRKKMKDMKLWERRGKLPK